MDTIPGREAGFTEFLQKVAKVAKGGRVQQLWQPRGADFSEFDRMIQDRMIGRDFLLGWVGSFYGWDADLQMLAR